MTNDARKERDDEEVAHALDISVSQIRNALAAGEAGIKCLSFNFIKVASAADRLSHILEKREKDEVGKLEEASDIANFIKDTLVASMEPFQFYDRLTQRMEHVIISLEHLAQYLEFKDESDQEEMYARILECYTLDDEKKLLLQLFEDIEYIQKDKIYIKSTGSVELF